MSEKISDKMKLNHDGRGYVYQVDDLVWLKRFLLLPITHQYYRNIKAVYDEAVSKIKNLIDNEPEKMIEITADYSWSGKIYKADNAIFILFMLWINGKRELVEKYFDKIVRIPTHLFMFMSFLDAYYGYGKIPTGSRLKKIIRNWMYNHKLDYYMLKYQSRHNIHWYDILNLVHPKPRNELDDMLFAYHIDSEKFKEKYKPNVSSLLDAFLELRKATRLSEVIKIIEKQNVPWEFIPTEWLNEPKIWRIMLPNLPLTALLRNLGRISSYGLLKNFSEEEKLVYERLSDKEALKKARIHPMQLFVTWYTYEAGKGFRGNLEWQPNNKILEILEDAFYASFEYAERSNKNYVLGVDVSGSMTMRFLLPNIYSLTAAGAVALTLLKLEPFVKMYFFDHTLSVSKANKNTSLKELINEMSNRTFGATNPGLVLERVIKEKIPVDEIVILTDMEVNTGYHFTDLLQRARDVVGRNIKFVTVAFELNDFSVADPDDLYQLDVPGFDPSIPRLLQEFSLI